jgi:phage head maturation protease
MRISADEAAELRRDHLRRGAAGVDQLMKVAQAPASWDAATRSARFVMTSQTTDRYGDVVVTGGLDTAQFEKNPVAFLNHDSRSWPIGSWGNVEKLLRGRPPRMEGDLALLKSGGPIPEVDQAAWMIANGYMKACSIGFIPNWDAIERVTDDKGEWTGGLKFNEAEIVECSLCGVPANPEALAKSIEGNVAFAREAIEQVLDNWARDPEGKLIERTAFEDLYRLAAKEEDVRVSIEEYLANLGPEAATAVCEKFIVAAEKTSLTQVARRVAAAADLVTMPRARLEALERGEKNRRLAEKRGRELDLIRARAGR